MTATKQSISADLKALHKKRKGKVIVYFEGDPIPPHNPEDTFVVFEQSDKLVL